MEGALFSLVAYFLTSRWFRTLRFFADRDLRFVLVFSGRPEAHNIADRKAPDGGQGMIRRISASNQNFL
jgi:hypothetical protein